MQKLLNAAYFYLRIRPRSEHEMRQYLEKKQKKYQLEEPQVQEVVDELKRQSLIDDQSFISWFVEIRGTSKKKSARMVRYELQRYGVSPDDIEQYFSSHEFDELQKAIRALSGRWRSLQAFDTKKRFERAATFLQRKGFSYSQIKTAIAEFEQKR